MPIKISQLPELASFTDDANTLMVLVDLTEPDNYTKTKKITVENFLKSSLEFGETPGVFYLSTIGDDTNDGSSWERAFRTMERALQAVENSDTIINLIDVAPGIYETEGHLDMPDNTVIKSTHRTAIFRPKTGFEERNVFRMGSGCFIEGLLFEDFRLDDMDNPTEGFAVSFRPGAVIRRAPYAHKIAVRTTPYWGVVPPPLERDPPPGSGREPNSLVGRGMGVALADGNVCSPYSIFPNIMTWGATPVSHNGIGYCAKNGGLINAINAVSIWQHKHFYAIDGGQIILSACSTQFGDYTMVAKGGRDIIVPEEVSITLTQEPASNTAIQAAANTIIENLWINLSTTYPTPNTGNVWTAGWDEEDEEFTYRDARTFLQSIGWVLTTANEKPMIDFAKGLFDVDGTAVFTSDKLEAFKHSFEYIRDEIIALPGVSSNAANIVTALVTALNTTIDDPTTRTEPSTITAVGHTWSSIFSGVALTKIPPARNLAKIQDSILELSDDNNRSGVVIASGQDDQGSALFVGGMTIDADTGELGGAPFISAVNRIANKIVISRSF
jgi:hypothetical protein